MTKVNCGPRAINLSIPAKNLCFELSPRFVSAVNDEEEEIHRAIKNPIGTKPLNKMLRPNYRVMIISDDNTRLTPAHKIIPILLDELNERGIDDQNIRMMIASGTHRPMTANEILTKFSDAVTSRIEVLNHDYSSFDNLVDYGITKRGTRIWINKEVIKSDFRIGIGSIIPHCNVGWGGGAKIVLPGVAGEETTAQVHLLAAQDPEANSLGIVNTPCREEIEDFAEKIGLHFLINTVLNEKGGIVKVVTGDFIKAHRIGVKWAKTVFGIEFDEQADITISSTYPVDYDLFQADKGWFSAAIATKLGGEIILLSPCYEGISPMHSGFLEIGNLSSQKIWNKVKQEEISDPLTAAEALYNNELKKNYSMIIVSDGITNHMAKRLGFKHCSVNAFPSFIEGQLQQNSKLRIGIIHRSAGLLPLRTT